MASNGMRRRRQYSGRRDFAGARRIAHLASDSQPGGRRSVTFTERVCEDGIGDGTLKIASWNVNSIRARVGHVTRWLSERQVDVLLMQELKGEVFPAEVFKEMGYESAAVTQKTYNGVAVV